MTLAHATNKATTTSKPYGRVPYRVIDAGIVAAMSATDRGVYIVIMAHAGGTHTQMVPA